MKGEGAIWVQRRKLNSAMQRKEKRNWHMGCDIWAQFWIMILMKDEKIYIIFVKYHLTNLAPNYLAFSNLCTIAPKVSLDTIHIYSRGVNSPQRGRKGVILVLGIVWSKNFLCWVCFSCMTCSFVLLSLKSNSVTCWKWNRASLGLLLLLPMHI